MKPPRLKLRKGWWIFFSLATFAWFAPATASAENYTTTGANDYFFSFPEPAVFTAQTSAWQYGIDSMLWFYDSSGNLLAANDDYFGLDSYINVNVGPGTYRLRTGVCCGDPNRWYGTSYTFTTSSSAINTTTTTSTTTPETTTSSTVQATETSPPTSAPQTTTSTSTTTSTTEMPVPESSTSTTSSTSSTSTTVQTTIAPPVVVPVAPPTTEEPVTTTELTTTTVAETTTTTQPPQTTTSSSSSTSTSTSTSTTVESTTTTTVVEEEMTTTTLALEEILEVENLEELTSEQAAEVFSSIDYANVSTEELKAIIEAVQSAPEEVREAFEASVDLFSGDFDEYVPVGSTISVGARRVVVAATAVLFVLPAPVVPSRRQKI